MRDQRLIELVEAFQARVRLAIALFEEHRGISDLMRWRQLGVPRKGFVTQDNRFEYAFHGIGCFAETPEGEIDWDFGPNGRADGVDLWRLQKFIEASPGRFPEYEGGVSLSQAFEQAIRDGVLQKDRSDPNGNLYYVTA